MKKWFQITALSSLVGGAVCASAATLTTDDVVKMVKARLNDDVIVQTIEATSSRFYLNAQDVERLKSKGVSDRVLAAMRSGAPSTSAANQGQAVQEPGSRSYEFPTSNTVVRAEGMTNTVVRATYVAPPSSWGYSYPPSAYDYYYYPPPAMYYEWSYPPPPLGFFSFGFGPGPRSGPGSGPGPRSGPGPGPGSHHSPRPPR